MPTLAEVMAELEAVGTAQNRKIYARHGAKEPLFGVSHAHFKLMVKKIKKDHALALQLWDTGNYDARTLAMMIADPQKADPTLLDTWVADSGNYGINDAITAYTAKTAYLRPKAEQWTQSPDEWPSTAGWGLMCYVSNTHKDLPDSYFEPYIQHIETSIHQQPNRTRYAMNNALINFGCRNAVIHERVKKAAAVIGEVYVDHGETNCETPIVTAYIERVLARKGYVLA